MFRREDVISAYHQALGSSARHGGLPERLRARTQPGAHFFEIVIPPGSIADGRVVKEFPWPEGCLLVSVNRGAELLVPSGSTTLYAGDAITAFGGDGPRDRLAERLSVQAEPGAPRP
jgi:Trk K+ transport system NAD-binding subunit